MMTSVTRSCFTTQHQISKTKTIVYKTKTDFLVSDRSCPKTDGLGPHHWYLWLSMSCFIGYRGKALACVRSHFVSVFCYYLKKLRALTQFFYPITTSLTFYWVTPCLAARSQTMRVFSAMCIYFYRYLSIRRYVCVASSMWKIKR